MSSPVPIHGDKRLQKLSFDSNPLLTLPPSQPPQPILHQPRPRVRKTPIIHSRFRQKSILDQQTCAPIYKTAGDWHTPLRGGQIINPAANKSMLLSNSPTRFPNSHNRTLLVKQKNSTAQIDIIFDPSKPPKTTGNLSMLAKNNLDKSSGKARSNFGRAST